MVTGRWCPWIELGFRVSGVGFIAGSLEEVGGTGGGLAVRQGGEAVVAPPRPQAVGRDGGDGGAGAEEEVVRQRLSRGGGRWFGQLM
jgi:hypothetical protein